MRTMISALFVVSLALVFNGTGAWAARGECVRTDYTKAQCLACCKTQGYGFQCTDACEKIGSLPQSKWAQLTKR